MAIPVSVVLDRTGYEVGPLDLTPMLDGSTITWSSVIPGGFASCSFQLNGDFRKLVKQVPYLSTLRVIGDSGRVLFEGELQDLQPTLNEQTAGLRVTAIGFQNALQQITMSTFWSKRDIPFVQRSITLTTPDPAMEAATGQIDQTDLTKAGLAMAGNGQTTSTTKFTDYDLLAPSGLTFVRIMFTYDKAGSTNQFFEIYSGAAEPAGFNLLSVTAAVTGGTQDIACNAGDKVLLFRSRWGVATAATAADFIKVYNVRALGQPPAGASAPAEDVAGGFYGGTLIRSLLNIISFDGRVQAGIIEAGSEFTVDHLDASVRRTCLDLINEVAQYYAKEWAVWEDNLLHWRAPNLSEPGWIIPIAQLSSLELDASTVNSFNTVVVLYTDAASGQSVEAIATSTDRRNPFVLTGKNSQRLVSASFPMTSNTSAQFATQLLQDLGFGPVPAAGSISLPGETIVNHSSQSAKKAWEIRAGDNVTIPELPMADVFTQDGRGETTFHVVSAEANGSSGTVTLSLDSYGSKRSDVLLARLAAVTAALGG